MRPDLDHWIARRRPWRPWRLGVSLLLLAACGGTVEVPDATTVTRSERVWVDASRPTPRTSRFPGAPERTLRTLIWMPAASGPLPLLVMAHGFGGLPEKFDAFARTVAAAGYVVAAPTFPLTNENAPGSYDVGLRDFINQPADLTFVLTQLLQAGATAGDDLSGRVVAADVAVLGHSLGGLTVIGLTRKDCCRDLRVRASILVAAAAPLTDSYGLDPISAGPPTLLVHGTADRSIAFSTSTTLYDQIEPPRYLVGIPGAGHAEGVESQAEPPIAARDVTQRAAIAFLDAAFRGRGMQFQRTLDDLAAAGNIVRAQAFGAN